MPWGALTPIGVGAGAAAGQQINQDEGNKQADFLAQLLMHAQSTQAQREQTQAIKEAQLASINQAREANQQNQTRNFNLRALEQIPGGDIVPPRLAQTPEAQDVTRPQMSLSGTQTAGFQPLPSGPAQQAFPSAAGGGPSTGESQAQTTPLQPKPTGNLTKIQSPQERERDALNASTAAQRDFTNKIQLRRIEDTEGTQADKSDIGWYRAMLAANRPQGPKPSFQEVDALSNMNSAEIQAVKVLNMLKQRGLDQSNDPADPRWNTFVAQDLKIRPTDESKADAIQRTAYVKAVLGRAIMGGRPSQYVMQMIEQHLPDSKMSGKQLSGVINDVLDEVRTKRVNMQNFYGPDEAAKMNPVGGMTYQQYLDAASKQQGGRNDGFVVHRNQ